MTFFSIKSIGTAEDLYPKTRPVDFSVIGRLRDIFDYPFLLIGYVGLALFYIVGAMIIFVQASDTERKVVVNPTQYLVSISTRDARFKKANPHITIIGDKGTSNCEPLIRWYQRGRYSWGGEKEFLVLAPNVGEIQTIILENKDSDVQWTCEGVKVLRWSKRSLWKFDASILINGTVELSKPVKHRRTIRLGQVFFTEWSLLLTERVGSFFFISLSCFHFANINIS